MKERLYKKWMQLMRMLSMLPLASADGGVREYYRAGE